MTDRPAILVVEDEPIVAADLELRLKALGYRVVGRAATGQRAVELADEFRPSLILMDIRLKGDMDGIEAAGEIRKRWNLPVVFLTAYSEDATFERAKQTGPYGYLIKPFESRELKTTIEVAIGKHLADVEVRRTNRLYAVLSQVNQAIVRFPSVDDLMNAVCRCMVNHGEFSMAWIGWLDSESGIVSPIARYGDGSDSVARTVALADDPGNLISASVRDRHPAIDNNLNVADSLGAGTVAIGAGLRSKATFPIRFRSEIWGVLAVYSTEPKFFEDKEVQLLDEVSGDLAFALETRDNDAKRRRAEEAVRESEAHFRTLVGACPDAITETDSDGRIVFASDQTIELFRYEEPDEALDRRLLDWVSEADRIRASKDLARASSGEHIFAEYTLVRSDGSPFSAEFIASALGNPSSGEVTGLIAVIRDVTERNQSEARLNSARFEIVLRLALAMEYRDDATGGHLQRLGTYSRLISERIGLPVPTCEMIQWAATLHDIGKLGVPDSILLKPGPLTPDEYRIMQTHTLLGAEILARSDHELIMAAEQIARSHHERWDGTGYPDGLAGEAIPLPARICSVCDVFDALTSERPYKAAWSFDDAAAEIIRCSGTQFDPALIAAFESQVEGFRAVFLDRESVESAVV